MTAPNPNRFDAIKALVSANDKQWFRDHPGDRFRYRPAIPGEMHPLTLHPDAMMEVEYIAPGIRRKAPYLVLTGTETETGGGR